MATKDTLVPTIETVPKLPWLVWSKIIACSDPETVNNLRLTHKEMNYLVVSQYKRLRRKECVHILFGTDDQGDYIQVESAMSTEKLQQRWSELSKNNFGCCIDWNLAITTTKKNVHGYTKNQIWSIRSNEVTLFRTRVDPNIDSQWFDGVETLTFFSVNQAMLDSSVDVFKFVKNVVIITHEEIEPAGIHLKDPEDFATLDSIMIEGDVNLVNFQISTSFMKIFAADKRHTFKFKKNFTEFGPDHCMTNIVCITREIGKLLEMLEMQNIISNVGRGTVTYEITVLFKSDDINRESLIENGFEYELIHPDKVTKISFNGDNIQFFIYTLERLICILGIETEQFSH